MNPRRPFQRKIAYLCGLVVLVLILSWLSPPPSKQSGSTPASPGGKLAQLRSQYGLSQANLGEIDPTSEAIKLATFGMRGVAANVLWTKATHAQKVRDWVGLSATLDQIIKLQPNFVAVWRFQSWNLAYNISADWDDYRDRYYWVIRGIKFLREGSRYNESQPILHWDQGWFIAQKIGRSDERREFRKLFREDDEFHGSRPVALRDNWLVGKESFLEAEKMTEQLNRPVKAMTPLLFHSDGPKCQINYATALEEDGTFGEVARVAWNQGAQDWQRYGRLDLVSPEGVSFRLDDLNNYFQELRELTAQLDAIAPGIRDQIFLERKMTRSEAERALLDKPLEERTAQENAAAEAVVASIEVHPRETLARIPEANRKQAETLVLKLEESMDRARSADSSNNIVMYNYWKARCIAERTPEAIAAREAIFAGDKAFRDADLESARDQYLKGFAEWRKVIDASSQMLKDGTTGEEMIDVILRYEQCLKQLDEPLPQDFVLKPLLDEHHQYYITPH